MNGNGSPDVPVWLLDVDGVINADSNKTGWPERTTRRYAYSGGHELTFKWAPSLVEAITNLIRSDAVEVRWATSWVHRISEVYRLLNIPTLPFAFDLPDDIQPASAAIEGASLAAKRAAALDVVASGRRLIWTDDDAIWTDGPERDRLEAAGSLLIAPAPNRGLQPADVDRIRTFLGL